MAWPELADVTALVRGGIPYETAINMSPLVAEETLALLSAWAIPEDERIGGLLEPPSKTSSKPR